MAALHQPPHAVAAWLCVQAHNARRSATVLALTETTAYKMPLAEFKKRMPHEVLEVRGPQGQGKGAWSKAVANQKDGRGRRRLCNSAHRYKLAKKA